MNGRVIALFPRRRSFTSRAKSNAIEVFELVQEFERNHARLAWGVTLFGFAIGLVLQSL